MTNTQRLVDNLHIPAAQLSKYISPNGFTVVTDFHNETRPNCNHIVAGASIYTNTTKRCRVLVHDFEYQTFVIQQSGRMAGTMTTLNARLAYLTSRAAWKELKNFKTAMTFGGGQRAAIAAMGKTSVEFLEDGDFREVTPEMYFGTYRGSSAVNPLTTAELAVCGHFKEIAVVPTRVTNRQLRALSDQVIDQALYDQFGFVQPIV